VASSFEHDSEHSDSIKGVQPCDRLNDLVSEGRLCPIELAIWLLHS
jgi:hypothetical protein